MAKRIEGKSTIKIISLMTKTAKLAKNILWENKEL